MPITTGNFPKALWPSINSWYKNLYTLDNDMMTCSNYTELKIGTIFMFAQPAYPASGVAIRTSKSYMMLSTNSGSHAELDLEDAQDAAIPHQPVIALTIDEGIEDYRENSIKNAIEFCNKLKIEHKIISFKEKIGFTLDEIIKLKENQPDKSRAGKNENQ